jgi:hypothetical protein
MNAGAVMLIGATTGHLGDFWEYSWNIWKKFSKHSLIFFFKIALFC